jgi:murein DD-endopeptidase MepM/ murein hydrolase activator NlpD
MHYVDLDPGGEPVDFGCGRQTYSNHDGTDFGIADLESMKRGMPVVAVAAGIILRVREGVDDRIIADQTKRASVDKIECGNGIIMDHGNGWQTQYCHLRKGSIAVAQGAKVDKGSVLGMVGASGLASFPHVHFTVRHSGKIIDPFVGETNISGCHVTHHPLWEKSPDYMPTGLIRSGFATKPPDQAALWRGEFTETKADLSKLAALIFWVHVFGTLKDDKEHFTLIAPDKRVIIDTEKPLKKSNKSWVSYTGKKSTVDHPLFKGEWRGTYQLRRGERTMIHLERTFLVE